MLTKFMLAFEYLVFVRKNGPLSFYTCVSYVTPRCVVGQDNIVTCLDNAMDLMFVLKLCQRLVFTTGRRLRQSLCFCTVT